jgi:TolB-like protein
MSLFEELKRRNVFRVGVAYTVGAWLLLQLTEVLSELLKLPDEIGPIVVGLVAIGFPVVLFLAWAFELTPEGMKREKDVDRSASITPQTGKKLDRVIIAMLVVVAGYFIWESRFADREPEREIETAAEASDPAPATKPGESEAEADISRQSIAVLPFTNRSKNEDDAFFVDGIHDDLLTNLARISGLKVISRTSVLRFKDTQKPIPEIAAELGVATIMEGAVQRAGDTVRINVQLIDAQTDEHLWAQIFDRELTANNLFAIQSEISQQIASALEATLSPEEQRRLAEQPTQNLEAYDAYLRGRQKMALRNAESVEAAMVEFRRAVELDPEFALAWAAMAENTRWVHGFSTMPYTEAKELRQQTAQRALQIDPDLGEAYMALALNDQLNDQFGAAEEKYRKAIELSPGFAQAYDWYSDFLQTFPGRRREALAMIRKAEELDPLAPEIQLEIAEQLNELGRFDEAESLARRVAQLNPRYPSAPAILSSILGVTGRFDEQALALRRASELDPGSPARLIDLAFTYVNLDRADALPGLQRIVADIDPDHWTNGWIELLSSMAANDFDGAMETSRWVGKQFDDAPWYQGFAGLLHLMKGEYAAAREAYQIASPEYFDRATWRAGLESDPGMGCVISFVLEKTGDEAMANDLRKLTVNYLEYELPGYIEHSDRFAPNACYVQLGDNDKAIEGLREQVEHGHIDAWWLWETWPPFEPIRDDERFTELLSQIRARVAAQRENLERLDERAGP